MLGDELADSMNASNLSAVGDTIHQQLDTLTHTGLHSTIDCNKLGVNGSSPLVMVCTQGRVRETRLLVLSGADVDFETLEFDDDPTGVPCSF